MRRSPDWDSATEPYRAPRSPLGRAWEGLDRDQQYVDANVCANGHRLGYRDIGTHMDTGLCLTCANSEAGVKA